MSSGKKKGLTLFVYHMLLVVFLSNSYGQRQDTIPSADVKYDQDQLSKYLPTLEILPTFLADYDGFWYSIQQNNKSVWTYYFVSAKDGKQYNLSDRSAIASAWKKKMKTVIDPQAIKLKSPGKFLQTLAQFEYEGHDYYYDPLKNSIQDAGKTKTKEPVRYRPVGEMSPDSAWVLVNRGYNLYLQSVADTAFQRQLSKDSEQYYSFNENIGLTTLPKTSMPSAYWYGQTGVYYGIRKNGRGVQTMTTLNSLTMNRPKSSTYLYEIPGDTAVIDAEVYVGSVADSSFSKIDVLKWAGQKLKIIPVDQYRGQIYFTRISRAYDEIELCAIDVQTGAVKVLIHEDTKPFLNEDLFNVQIVNGGKDIIWWSDRTGWGHYYHYDGQGTLLGKMTSGEWTAGEIIDLDLAKQKVLLYGYGREINVNPNYAMVYDCDLSNGKIARITLENADHKVRLTPSRKHFIHTYSTIEQPPVTVLRSLDGRFISEVYRPDLSALYHYGWRSAEPFSVKAADDSTALHGIMWKPFDFDPQRKYPIISQVYPGPQTETVWTKFTVIDRYNNTALANKGFIVVCMGHRGGSPYRSAAYYKYGYGNLRDYPLADDKYGIEQLISSYKFIDAEKVGITGHSGGGMMAFAALATYPDFYKAAVASAGNHDNRIYNRAWGEKYQGFAIAKSETSTSAKITFKTGLNQDLAKNIKGNLLLVVGESDNNVNPASTMRVVQALIQADKDFELLVLPGQNHTYEGISKKYYERRQRDFFYKNLVNK